MPIIVLAIMLLMSISQCAMENAQALAIQPSKLYNSRVDLSRPVRNAIRDQLGLPPNVTIDKLDKNAVKVRLLCHF